MRAEKTPKKYIDEENRLFNAWLNLDGSPSFSVFVSMNASPAYKSYYFDYQNKKKKLREKGIYVN